MGSQRRKFLKTVLTGAGPVLLLGKSNGYSDAEVATMIRERGMTEGVSKADLSTPCLLLDLDRFEANIRKMSEHARSHSIGLRPHAKTHKCAEIASRQVKAGARGVCVATIAEAEVMARAGIKGLLITSEMVGKPKVSRLVKLVRLSPDTMAVVDNPDNVAELQQAAEAARVRIPVLIDLDVGSNRTGVASVAQGLQLAEKIGASKNLDLRGICAYAGHSSHVVGFEARKNSSFEAMSKAIEAREQLKQRGHNVEILTGGSTGTYNIDSSIKGMSELQVGSYVFMDVDYRKIGGQSAAIYDDFAPSLTVLCTVIHRSGNKAVVDAGFKAFTTDRKFGPEPKDLTGVKYGFAGDEHGALTLEDPNREVRLGDRLEWIIPHCDPNVNLYDRIYCVRGDKVEGVWSIMDRASTLPYF